MERASNKNNTKFDKFLTGLDKNKLVANIKKHKSTGVIKHLDSYYEKFAPYKIKKSQFYGISDFRFFIFSNMKKTLPYDSFLSNTFFRFHDSVKTNGHCVGYDIKLDTLVDEFSLEKTPLQYSKVSIYTNTKNKTNNILSIPLKLRMRKKEYETESPYERVLDYLKDRPQLFLKKVKDKKYNCVLIAPAHYMGRSRAVHHDNRHLYQFLLDYYPELIKYMYYDYHEIPNKINLENSEIKDFYKYCRSLDLKTFKKHIVHSPKLFITDFLEEYLMVSKFHKRADFNANYEKIISEIFVNNEKIRNELLEFGLADRRSLIGILAILGSCKRNSEYNNSESGTFLSPKIVMHVTQCKQSHVQKMLMFLWDNALIQPSITYTNKREEAIEFNKNMRKNLSNPKYKVEKKKYVLAFELREYFLQEKFKVEMYSHRYVTHFNDTGKKFSPFNIEKYIPFKYFLVRHLDEVYDDSPWIQKRASAALRDFMAQFANSPEEMARFTSQVFKDFPKILYGSIGHYINNEATRILGNKFTQFTHYENKEDITNKKDFFRRFVSAEKPIANNVVQEMQAIIYKTMFTNSGKKVFLYKENKKHLSYLPIIKDFKQYSESNYFKSIMYAVTKFPEILKKSLRKSGMSMKDVSRTIEKARNNEFVNVEKIIKYDSKEEWYKLFIIYESMIEQIKKHSEYYKHFINKSFYTQLFYRTRKSFSYFMHTLRPKIDLKNFNVEIEAGLTNTNYDMRQYTGGFSLMGNNGLQATFGTNSIPVAFKTEYNNPEKQILQYKSPIVFKHYNFSFYPFSEFLSYGKIKNNFLYDIVNKSWKKKDFETPIQEIEEVENIEEEKIKKFDSFIRKEYEKYLKARKDSKKGIKKEISYDDIPEEFVYEAKGEVILPDVETDPVECFISEFDSKLKKYYKKDFKHFVNAWFFFNQKLRFVKESYYLPQELKDIIQFCKPICKQEKYYTPREVFQILKKELSHFKNTCCRVGEIIRKSDITIQYEYDDQDKVLIKGIPGTEGFTTENILSEYKYETPFFKTLKAYYCLSIARYINKRCKNYKIFKNLDSANNLNKKSDNLMKHYNKVLDDEDIFSKAAIQMYCNLRESITSKFHTTGFLRLPPKHKENLFVLQDEYENIPLYSQTSFFLLKDGLKAMN